MCDESAGLLHNYQFLYQIPKGTIEKCINTYCGEKQFFPNEVPNDVYLSHHIRSALQVADALFKVNYPQFDYSLLR